MHWTHANLLAALTFSVMALVAGVTASPLPAHAQAASASGIATGGDKVTAIVPEAGDIFTDIDEITILHEDMLKCAKQGLFYDQATDKCRQGIPPQVSFYESGGGTYVDVQRASPNHAGDPATYGSLDGNDGTYETVPWSE